MYFIGFDIGGSKIECALFKKCEASHAKSIETLQKNHICFVDSLRMPTERQKGYDSIIEKMASLIENLCQTHHLSPREIQSIGAGVPGTVHPLEKVMLNGSISAFFHREIGNDLNARLQTQIPFLMDNDANCFALAEFLGGAGPLYVKNTNKSLQDCVAIGLILGTGFGGGIITYGRVLTGRIGSAGEVGHSVLFPGGTPCYCGNQGCAEQYLSGTAIEAMFHSRMYSHIGKFCNAKEIFELYHHNEPLAQAVIKQYKKNLALFIGKMCTILNPDFFVLGGGISQQDIIYENLENKSAENSFISSNITPIFKNVLGDSAGIIGAVLLGIQSVK